MTQRKIGAKDLAEKVVELAEKEENFTYTYDLNVKEYKNKL